MTCGDAHSLDFYGSCDRDSLGQDRIQAQRIESQQENAGHEPVKPFNPYWDKNGRTFEDPDGYRVVLQNAEWDG